MVKYAALFLLCLCSGCSENYVKEENRYKKCDDTKDFQEICRRIRGMDVVVVSPGSGVATQFASYLKKSNFNIPDTSLINHDVFGSSDTDDHRLNHFIDAVNSDHKIIWALRGGFGAARLIASLDRLPKPCVAKTFIGFSDITSLNLFISQKWPNWRVIHATVFAYLDKKSSKNKFGTLLDILGGKIDSYDINNLHHLNEKAKTQKDIIGKLTGGNLTIIENSLKTCWEIQTDGKIVFIEDVREEPQCIYRTMYHLKEVGKLSGAKALIFGCFNGVSDQKKVLLYLKGFAKTLDIPVYATNQFGHGDYNVPLIYNATAKIRGGKMTISVPHS